MPPRGSRVLSGQLIRVFGEVEERWVTAVWVRKLVGGGAAELAPGVEEL